MEKARIGIDLGGTKIEGVVMKGRTISRRLRVSTPRGDYRGTLRAVAGLVERLEEAAGEAGLPVGLGMPGSFSGETGLVKNANSTCLIGRPLRGDLQSLLGRPVRVANDADCFTLSEAVDGAGEGASIVFGVILGTGVGGGLAVDGKLLSGPNAITGEWGHNPLPAPGDDERPGPSCYCGRRGCIETFLSGSGLVRAYEASGGSEIPAPEVASRAAAGEKAARGAMQLYGSRLARALAGVINIVDPHVVVLGGGLSNIGPIYEIVPGMLAQHVFSDSIRTRLVPPVHGDAGGVRGAAWLWDEAGETRSS